MSKISDFFKACQDALFKRPKAIAVEDLSEEEARAIANAEVPDKIDYYDDEET